MTTRGMAPVILLLLACACLAGCSTKRVLTVDSNPTGAKIWVNGIAQKRPTPVEIPYSYPGRIEIRIEMPGYESVATEIDTPTHIEDWPVVDLVTERLVSSRRTRRVIELKPIQRDPKESDVQSTLGRARTFRRQAYESVKEPGTPRPEEPQK